MHKILTYNHLVKVRRQTRSVPRLLRTQLDFCGEAELVDHADLEGLVVMAAQHVLNGGDINGRVLFRALLTPGAWQHNNKTHSKIQSHEGCLQA